MLSPYRIIPNTNKRKQKFLYRKHDLEGPQMTSNDLKRPQMISEETPPIVETVKPKKTKLKRGANIEIIDK